MARIRNRLPYKAFTMNDVGEALEALAEAVAPCDQKSASRLRQLRKRTPRQIADDLFLWGGEGSLMDQSASGQGRETQRVFENRAIALGRALQEAGATSARMEKWIAAFETWAKDGV